MNGLPLRVRRTRAVASLLVPVLAALPWFPAAGQAEQQPITVTAEARAAYQTFQQYREPLFFAISTDGQAFGFNFCPTPRPCRRATARANAIRLCERNSGGTTCQIYADARRVLWTGPPVIGLEGVPARLRRTRTGSPPGNRRTSSRPN